MVSNGLRQLLTFSLIQVLNSASNQLNSAILGNKNKHDPASKHTLTRISFSLFHDGIVLHDSDETRLRELCPFKSVFPKNG